MSLTSRGFLAVPSSCSDVRGTSGSIGWACAGCAVAVSDGGGVEGWPLGRAAVAAAGEAIVRQLGREECDVDVYAIGGWVLGVGCWVL